MKIVFVSNLWNCPWGGSEELWSQAALRLHEQNHEISASVVFWPQLAPNVKKLIERGAEVFFHSPTPSTLSARLLRRVLPTEKKHLKWILNQRPDLVVVSQGGNADGVEWMVFCQTEGLPYVSIVQANSESFWPGDKLAAEMAKGYGGARKIFSPSRNNLQLLERQIGTSLPNQTIVRNPFNPAAQEPPPWPSINGTWKLACVARLEPGAKGQDLLLQVLAEPKWRERSVEVNFYGRGAFEKGLRQWAAGLKLPNVHFRGHVEDVKEIWANNHLLVMPSRFEGLPITLVEAMWCERAAVVTDVGDSADLCVDGKTGFVVHAPTVQLLDDALERAWSLRADAEAMGKAARARVQQYFPPDPVGEFCDQLLVCAQLI